MITVVTGGSGIATGGDLRARGRRPRARTSFFGVVGEILITAGLITLLYVVWQLWIGDVIYGAERNAAGHELSEQWAEEYEAPPAAATASPTPGVAAAPAPVTADPIALPQPADAEIFGIMHIPRFGADYSVNMAGGVTRENTLDPIGIGHYPDTSMPGDVGNFAVAAHRTTWGKPFNRIADLHVGDAIVIETPDGWYTYRFRTLEYVEPSAVDVLLPVPQAPDVPNDGGRYLTMTSCSPMFAMTERIVGYSVFDAFTPRAAGAPASLTEGVTT
ncbi:class E sortase [Microbacterium sp. P01]|uniref:class E sortase n=1 Tax=unclassified Microbacterium TaxID=2609290 RepID=UPI00366B1D10